MSAAAHSSFCPPALEQSLVLHTLHVGLDLVDLVAELGVDLPRPLVAVDLGLVGPGEPDLAPEARAPSSPRSGASSGRLDRQCHIWPT